MSELEEEDIRSIVEYEDELKHETIEGFGDNNKQPVQSKPRDLRVPKFCRERAEGPGSGDDL